MRGVLLQNNKFAEEEQQQHNHSYSSTSYQFICLFAVKGRASSLCCPPMMMIAVVVTFTAATIVNAEKDKCTLVTKLKSVFHRAVVWLLQLSPLNYLFALATVVKTNWIVHTEKEEEERTGHWLSLPLLPLHFCTRRGPNCNCTAAAAVATSAAVV